MQEQYRLERLTLQHAIRMRWEICWLAESIRASKGENCFKLFFRRLALYILTFSTQFYMNVLPGQCMHIYDIYLNFTLTHLHYMKCFEESHFLYKTSNGCKIIIVVTWPMMPCSVVGGDAENWGSKFLRNVRHCLPSLQRLCDIILVRTNEHTSGKLLMKQFVL
jgi:hypothetical protein